MSVEVSAAAFRNRLVSLCINGGDGLPKKQRDLHILLASATLWMKDGTTYSEPEINVHLRHWIDTVCERARLDELTIRRELVDSRFLLRDDAGSHYTTGPGPTTIRFAPDIAEIDPELVIRQARSERAARKAAHLSDGA
ncbi:MAG: DUF2087 domain-containing protein [Acidimicrobiia bacterium]